MFAHRLARRSLASLALLSAAGAGVLVPACAPPPAAPAVTPVQPSASVVVAPPAPKWLPIEAEPEHDRGTRWIIKVSKEAEIRVDSAGMRWLVSGTESKRADSFLPEVPERLVWQDGIGLVLVTEQRKVFIATEPLGPFVERATLPADADVKTTIVFRGGLGIIVNGKPMFSDDLTTWKPIGPMGDRVATQGVVGRDGKGIALFAPQAVGVTTDGGKTWTPLQDDESPMVRLSVDDEDPTAILVEPRRPRDQLARRWHVGDTSLDLFASVDPPRTARKRGRRASLQDSKWFDLLADTAPVLRKRHWKGAGLHQSQLAIDGDNVVFGAHYRTEGEKVAIAWDVAPLGGAIKRVTQTLDAPPKERGLVKLTACAGSVAVSMNNEVRVTDAQGAVKTFPVGATLQRIAFFGPRKLIAVSADDQDNRGDGEGYSASAYEIDLDASDPKTAVKKSKLDSKDDFSTGTLVGGCAASTKSAWLVTHARGLRLQTLRDGSWSTVVKPDKEHPGTQDVLAIEPDGTLVLLELGDKTGKVLRVTPAGEISSSDTGFRLHSQLLVGDPIARRAVVLDAEGHAHMTTDAGASWTLLSDPPALVRKSLRVMLCGATRCEMDDAVVRVGWEPDPEGSLPVIATGDAKTPPVDAVGPAPTSLTCSIDRAATPKISDKLEGVQGIAAGRGDALWAGVASAKSTQDNPPAHFVALQGKADGSVTSQELGRGLPERDAFWFTAESIGAVFVTAMPRANDDTLTYTLAWQHDFSKPPKRSTLKSMWIGSDVFSRTIQTEDGFALIEPSEQKIHWFHGDGKISVRPWPGMLTGRMPTMAGARMIESASGTWFVMLPAAELLELPDAGSVLSLLSIEPDGARKIRTLRVLSSGLEERGLGLVKDRGGISLAVVERTSEGGLELRLRAIGADLSLGAAKVIPGAKSAAGKILSLPACGASPSGETMTLMTDDEAAVMVDGSDHAGVMMRRVRVTPSSACVERTMITRALATDLESLLPHESDLEIVVAGNGEGAGVLQDKKENEATQLTAIRCALK